jgi:hypothetical protein
VQRGNTPAAFITLSTAAAANTPGMHQYTSADVQPLSGANYYRLEITDKNGLFTYSKTIIINKAGAGAIVKAWPNPVANFVTITFNAPPGAKYIVDITGINGTCIQRITGISPISGENNLAVNMQNVAAGTYIISVTDDINGRRNLQIAKGAGQ